MAILTTNPGYIAAQIYDNDPANQEVPDVFHNDYHNGVTSYTLATAAGSPPVFTQDVNGLVPGPTADDITNDRLIQADGTWVDPAGGGGMNKTGGGTFNEAVGSNIGGSASPGTTITSNSPGSLTSVSNTSTGVTVSNGSTGGVITGAVFGGSAGNMSIAGQQSWLHGALFIPSGTADISVNADFGWLHGRTSGDSKLQVNQDAAMMLYGFAGGGAEITLSGASTGILHANDSNIDVDGFMNFAVGFNDGSTNPATLAVLSPGQPNETTSVLMVGHAADAGSVTIGDAAVQMIGGYVLGAAIGAGAVLRATRSGGSATGFASVGETIESVALNAHQFCEGSNAVANSLQVGAVGTGVHLHAGGLPAAPANGDIWTAGGDVLVRSGGVSVTIAAASGGGLNQSGAGFTEIASSNAGGRTTGDGTVVASGEASLAYGDSDDGTLRDILASGPASVAMGSAVGSVSVWATGTGSMQFGGGSNTTDHSAQFGGTARFNWGTPGFSLFGAPVNGQQVHVADPTDLAECITAITAINAMCAAYGLTAAA